jgi:hypothetical protein
VTEPAVTTPDAPDVEPASATDGRRRPWSAERRAKQALAQQARRDREKGGPAADPTGKPKRRSATARAPGTAPRQKPLKPRLQQAYETLGTVVGLISVPDGEAILAHSESCAAAVTEWAEQDPRVRAALERMLSGSVLGKVVVAHLPIVMAVGMNHGLIPASGLGALFGGPAPEPMPQYDVNGAPMMNGFVT